MFRKVDVEVGETEELEGFCYANKNGFTERVTFKSRGVVRIEDSNEDGMSDIYIEDIPKLIKALEAAYKEKIGEL